MHYLPKNSFFIFYYWYSGSSTIVNNTCNYNNSDGIRLWDSGSSTIVNNTCNYNNGDGIYLEDSDNPTVTNNTCNNNGNGIHLYNRGSTIINNTCNNNNYVGIKFQFASSSTVTNNTCNNNDRGIYLYYSAFCDVTYNLIQANEGYGVYLRSNSHTNLIHHNTFVANNLGGTSQAFDDCTDNIWNDTATLEGNYWSDWSGIGSYSIDGSASSSDLCPLDEPTVYTGPPILANITHYPSLPTELDIVSINATIISPYDVQSGTLHYRVNCGTWIEVSMTLVNGDIYSVTIGPFAVSDTIEYYITAVDNSSNHNEATEDNGGLFYSVAIGSSVDITAPSITDIVHSPYSPTELNTISINATVIDDSGIYNITLHYRVNGGTWQTISMTHISDNLYSVTIGSFTVSDTIEYYISAIDNSINHNEVTEDNGGLCYVLTIGSSDVTSPAVVDIIHSPSSPTELDTVSINATVTDDSGIYSVTLHYRVNGGAWIEVSMTLINGDLYSVTLGSFAVSDTIEYYVSAVDNSVNNNSAINDNSGLYYSFTISEVVLEFQMFSLLFPVITFLFLGFGLVVKQQRKRE